MSVSSITSRALNNKELCISSAGTSALRPSFSHRHIPHDIASRALSCSWSAWDEGHHRFPSFSTHASRGSRVPHGPSSDTESQPLPSGSADGSSGGSSPSNGDSSAPAKYSPLHMNIEEFCCKIIPTEDEKKVKQEVVEGVRHCTGKAFPDLRGKAKVEIFGSFANGLSTWHSDVDLVVTGLFEPDRLTGCYDTKDRGRVTARLRKIADQLRKFKKMDISRLAIIGRARIPIIKLRTRNNVSVDISISDSTGPQAARYITQQVRQYPPMKALTLVLKAYLKTQRLNDVATGGLSSYSLCNMVVAHLQEELKGGRDIFDLGESLYSFFLRYGEEFDYETEAVSVRSGGIVPKRTLPFATDGARFAASTMRSFGGGLSGDSSWNERLCVDCPLSGRDVSNGTYRIDVVRQSFYRAARQLEALARGRSINDSSINYLSALFDVQRVLKRMHVDEDPFFKVIGGDEREILTAGRRGGRTFDSPPFGMLADSLEDEGEDWEIDVDGSQATSFDDDEPYDSDGGSGRAAVAAAAAAAASMAGGDFLEREPSSRVQGGGGNSRGKGSRGR